MSKYHLTNAFILIVLTITLSSVSMGQNRTVRVPGKDSPKGPSNELRSSGAFAEVLLRRTELEADLEALLVEYTDDFPKVKESRFELDLIKKESDRLLAVNASDTGKLTTALGKLMVRKVELEGELWGLQEQFGESHPDVKRARRKVEIYEKAIKEILG